MPMHGLVQILVVSLDDVGALLGHHVDGILDATVRNDGEHRRIDHSHVLQAVYLEPSIDHALFNVL